MVRRRACRNIPLVLVPLWTPSSRRPNLSAAPPRAPRRSRSRRTRRRSVCRHPRPEPVLDPLFRRGNDLRMSPPCTSAPRPSAKIAPGRPFLANSPGPMRTSGAMLSWIFSGMFQRFPNLKIALSEARSAGSPTTWSAPSRSSTSSATGCSAARSSWSTAGADTLDLDTLDIRETFPTTSTAASSTTRTASPASTRSARTTSLRDRTTRTPTPPGQLHQGGQDRIGHLPSRPVQAAARQRRAPVPLHPASRRVGHALVARTKD